MLYFGGLLEAGMRKRGPSGLVNEFFFSRPFGKSIFPHPPQFTLLAISFYFSFFGLCICHVFSTELCTGIRPDAVIKVGVD